MGGVFAPARRLRPLATAVRCAGLALAPVIIHSSLVRALESKKRGELIGALVVGLLPLAAVMGIIFLRYL